MCHYFSDYFIMLLSEVTVAIDGLLRGTLTRERSVNLPISTQPTAVYTATRRHAIVYWPNISDFRVAPGRIIAIAPAIPWYIEYRHAPISRFLLSITNTIMR